LPETLDTATSLDELSPRQIVAELDKYVIGQSEAKRSVATALRNRMRRQKLPPEQAEEILPKNIIMIGPTGVGKTEIARRLARLTNSPFLKVEASRFTEVGYVGRDVESMVRDLVEIAIDMVREERVDEVAEKAEQNAEERLLDLLLPPPPALKRQEKGGGEGEEERSAAAQEQFRRTREKLRAQLRDGKLDERQVDIEVRDRSFPAFEVISSQGVEEMDINIKDILPGLFGSRTKKRRMRVTEAMDYLIQEEENRLIDMDQVTRVAVDHSLTTEDFVRILKEPKGALVKQYAALLETEGIKLSFADDALEEIAKFAAAVNEQTENIGARRLHTIMEKLLDEISFEGPDLKKKTVRIDAAYVQKQLAAIVKNQDLSRYIL